MVTWNLLSLWESFYYDSVLPYGCEAEYKHLKLTFKVRWGRIFFINFKYDLLLPSALQPVLGFGLLHSVLSSLSYLQILGVKRLWVLHYHHVSVSFGSILYLVLLGSLVIALVFVFILWTCHNHLIPCDLINLAVSSPATNMFNSWLLSGNL